MEARRTVPARRSPLAIDLELAHGRHGAAARIEFRDAADGTLAAVHVRGWIDPVALGRLEEILEDLACRGVARVALDCSQLRHIDYRLVGLLAGTLARLETRSLTWGWCGLSPHLRDLFRLAGCDPALHELVSAESGIPSRSDLETSREWAS